MPSTTHTVKNLYKLLSISLLVIISFQNFAQKDIILEEDIMMHVINNLPKKYDTINYQLETQMNSVDECKLEIKSGFVLLILMMSIKTMLVNMATKSFITDYCERQENKGNGLENENGNKAHGRSDKSSQKLRIRNIKINVIIKDIIHLNVPNKIRKDAKIK